MPGLNRAHLKKILTEFFNKIMKMKRQGQLEFTLSKILEPTLYRIIATYFGRRDRKLFFEKFHITEHGDGKKRKWSLSKDSFIQINDFPFKEDFKLLEDDIIQTKKSRVTDNFEETPTESIPLNPASPNLIQPRTGICTSSPIKDFKTHIQEYMKEYRSQYSEEENVSYLRSIALTYTSNEMPISQLSQKQRWNKLGDMKRNLGQCHLDAKEYSDIIIRIKEERLQQNNFSYLRKGEEPNFKDLTENDVERLQI